MNGVSKFVFVPEGNNFYIPPLPPTQCSSIIPNASAGRDPFVYLQAPVTLNSATAAYVPSIITGASGETWIAAQNVGNEQAPIRVYYFDDRSDFISGDCGVIGPGSSHLFGPESIPEGAKAAVLLFELDEFYGTGHSFFDDCNGFRDTGLPEDKTISKGTSSGSGMDCIVSVKRTFFNLESGSERATTLYNGFSDRFGDYDFSGTHRRYALPKVSTSASVETNISIFNEDPAPSIVNLRFVEAISGNVIYDGTQYLVGYDQAVIQASDYVGEGFDGALIVEDATDDLISRYAIIADIQYETGPIATYRAIPLDSGPFEHVGDDYAITPVLFEPGRDHEVTVFPDGISAANFNIELLDANGMVIDVRTQQAPPETPVSQTLPDPNLGPNPIPGYIRVTSDQEFQGVVQAVKTNDSNQVVESYAVNMHLEKEVGDPRIFSDPSKGNFSQEAGGADLLALPLLNTFDPTTGKGSEIWLTNTNPRDGLTSINLYVYDTAGLVDVECYALGPSETLRIPVDSPRLGEGALASVVIEAVSTSQKAMTTNDSFNAFALAALAVERTSDPHPVDTSVDLANGDNDPLSAYTTFRGIPDVALFHFPVVRSGDQIDSGTVSIQLTLTSDMEPAEGLAFGTVFFDQENVAGVVLSPTDNTPLTYCIENDQIPANARSGAVLKLPIGATEALHQFLNIDRSGDYVDFVFLLNKLLPSDNPLIHAVIDREEPTANGMGLARSSYEAQPFAPTFLDPDNLILSGQELLFPVVLTDGGFDTTLYIQNAERVELGCEILFFEIEKPQEAPLAKGLSLGDPLVDWLGAKSFSTTRPRSVHLESIHPGSTRAIHPRDYVGKGFRGRAVIRSLGSIVGCADIFSGGTLATYSGRRVAVGGQSGSLEAYGPLALSPLAGWETSVYVQNLGRTDDAKVRVTLYGSNGVPTQIQSGFAPARSSVEFRFPTADYQDNPETGEGWVLIESEDYHIGDGLFVEAPNVLGVVHLTKRSESGCILEAVAYNTLNRQEAYLEDFIGAINNYAPFPAVFKGYSDDELNTSFSMVNFDPTPHDLISNDLLFRGEDFMTMLSPITLPPRSSRIVSVNDYAGIPSGSKGSLLAPFQVNGTGFLGLGAVGFTRAEALLPHSECVGENETPTQTPTGTITSTPTLSPTETPTGTLTITSSQTPTVTPTATEMGGENEQMRADINRNRKIDHEDLLILLKWYLTEYK